MVSSDQLRKRNPRQNKEYVILASKEQCERARQDLAWIADKAERRCGANYGLSARDWKTYTTLINSVGEFLNVAKRKLPTEAEYERDRRKRQAAKA